MADVVEVIALALGATWDRDDTPPHGIPLFVACARAALSALSEAGWVVVPKDFHRLNIEPKDIHLPYPDVYGGYDDYERMELAREVFELVLSATPTPQETQ